MVAKLKIEITKNELNAISSILPKLEAMPSVNREVKVSQSALQKVIIKIINKTWTTRTTTKSFKMNFDFYEAHFLELFLISIQNVEYNHFIQNVINKLNEKLV